MLAAFGIYFCILTAIGIFFYSRTKTSDDFILGNRSVGYLVTAIATQASDMGPWLFLAFPAKIFTRGIPEIWTAIGLIVFMFLSWQFIAPKLRASTEDYHSMTLSSYFEQRFGDSSGVLRILAAGISIIFFTFYISSSIVGLGRLFESAFGLNYHTGTLLGLGSAIIYTLIGGFVAVAWCDFFQGMFLLLMIVLVPTCAYFSLDGFSTIMAKAHEVNFSFSLLPSEGLLNALLLAAGWGLGYFGQPHILVNFMGIDDTRKINYAKYVGLTWLTIVLIASAMIGIVGVGYFGSSIEDSQLLFITMTKNLFPSLIAGFVLCGILAATLSTMDSHILISGSVLAEDLYKKVYNRQASSKTVVLATRAGSIVVSLIALLIAQNNSASIYDLVNYAWSGLGSSFGPLILVSLYSQRVTRLGALAGLIVGSGTSAVWPFFNTTVLPLVPGFGLGLLAIFLVSAISKKIE